MDDLTNAVCTNLNEARANGFFEPGEALHAATDLELAGDLIAYSSDFEDLDDPAVLLGQISAWRRLYPL